MKEFTLNIPALLFPALSLLMIAYTTRFLGIANVVRALHKEHEENPSKKIAGQIRNLRKRLSYIRNMQAFAIAGFTSNIISMFMVLINQQGVAIVLFGLSLLLLIISLIYCFLEIYTSVGALTIQLSQDEVELCEGCALSDKEYKEYKANKQNQKKAV